MICEFLHPIFDALDDEFGFHGLDCEKNYRPVRKSRWQIGNAQYLRRIKQRKSADYHVNNLIAFKVVIGCYHTT